MRFTLVRASGKAGTDTKINVKYASDIVKLSNEYGCGMIVFDGGMYMNDFYYEDEDPVLMIYDTEIEG